MQKSIVTGLMAGFLGLGMMQGGLFAQQKTTFKVSGPCASCGAARVEGIVKGLDGVTSASYNAGTAMLSVDFNPVAASLIDIQLELSLQGYDAGDFMHDAKAKLPACAGGGMRGDQADADLDEPGIDDIDGLEADTDWENPDALGLADSDDDDIDLLNEDDEDDSDLTSLVGDDGDGDGSVGIDDEEEEDDDL